MKTAESRGRIGIVPQDSVIFSGSAADNIRSGPEATHDDVVAAPRAAFAHDFIAWRTWRAAVGRATPAPLHRASAAEEPTLVAARRCDECAQCRERAHEVAIAAATTLVSAHRLATVQRAHRIVVMDASRIVHVGTHCELMARGGLCARLAALQFASHPVSTFPSRA